MTVYMVTHKMEWLLQELRNIYYFETQTGNPTGSEWQDIVDEIRADYDAYLKTYMSSDWKFYGIDYRVVDSAGYNTFSAVPTSGDLVGTGVVDDTATQIACLASVKGITTKPNKVRTYLGGFVESAMSNSLWTSGVITNVTSFITNQGLLNSLGTNVLERVSVTWNSSHTVIVAHNSVYLGAIKISQVPATQRRRRIGVGI